MPKDTRQAFMEQLDKISPTLKRSFSEAVQDIRSASQLRLLEDAIDRGDLDAAFKVLHLGPVFFAPLDRALGEAFYSGGIYQMSRLPKRIWTGSQAGPLIIRFNGRNPRAEAWVREHSARLIAEITEDQRRLVADTIRAGLRSGRNPRAMALDLAGRVQGNHRLGGLIGLHSNQAAAVRRMRIELSDPGKLGGYFKRASRDRRFDATVRKALSEGRKLNQRTIAKITGRYADRLLKTRADAVARTEGMAAMNAGRLEALDQLVERGDVPRQAVVIQWDATGDARTRQDHAAMNGQTVVLGQPFVFPDGSKAKHPCDGSLGAPGSQTINCRCYAATKIDWLSLAQ